MGVVGAKVWGDGIRYKGGFTIDLVHRTHLDIFGEYYPPQLDNWYVDDWITYAYVPWKKTYDDERAFLLHHHRRFPKVDFIVVHKFTRRRYRPSTGQQALLPALVECAREAIAAYVRRVRAARADTKDAPSNASLSASPVSCVAHASLPPEGARGGVTCFARERFVGGLESSQSLNRSISHGAGYCWAQPTAGAEERAAPAASTSFPAEQGDHSTMSSAGELTEHLGVCTAHGWRRHGTGPNCTIVGHQFRLHGRPCRDGTDGPRCDDSGAAAAESVAEEVAAGSATLGTVLIGSCAKNARRALEGRTMALIEELGEKLLGEGMRSSVLIFEDEQVLIHPSLAAKRAQRLMVLCACVQRTQTEGTRALLRAWAARNRRVRVVRLTHTVTPSCPWLLSVRLEVALCHRCSPSRCAIRRGHALSGLHCAATRSSATQSRHCHPLACSCS